MSAQTETITLSVSDGTSMRAYVARPAGQARAGLIVFQEAFGVNAHIRDITERFAAQGYLAIAPELFHRTAPGFEGSYTDFPAVMPHMKALTDNGLAADARAAFDWLQKEGKASAIGCIGYCMGGRTACLAAITMPVNCAVSYYGRGSAGVAAYAGVSGHAPGLGFAQGRSLAVKARVRRIRPTSSSRTSASYRGRCRTTRVPRPRAPKIP